jgi:hypothetical protein
MAGISAAIASQPFFYPVLNESYATQIAREWNTQNGGTGYVLRCQVDWTDRDREFFPAGRLTAKAKGPDCSGPLNFSFA